MRAVAQELVLDTSSTNPGLSTAEWLILLNDAMFAYASQFPNLLPVTGLLGTAAITSGNSSTTLTLNALTASARNITNAFVRGVGPCERVELMDILRLIAQDTTQGAPTQYAIMSSTPGVTTTALVYTVKLWRIADASYNVDFYGTVNPITLTGDTDTTVFQEGEAREIARMAAVDASRLLGRPDSFTAQLIQSASERVKEKFYSQSIDTRPRSTSGKTSV